MSRQTLTENLNIILKEPHGITLIERLLLDLAVSGKMKSISKEFGNYKIHKLGEVCDLYQPKTISTAQLIPDGDYPVYGANGVIGRFDKFNHEESEILVTCRGATCGTVNISQPFSWINGNAMVVRPKHESLRRDFLALVLKSIDYEKVITGTAQPQITRAPLSKVEIIVPSLEAQELVVLTINGISALLGEIRIANSSLKEVQTAARKSSVDAISTAKTIEELQVAWERIEANWDLIADTPEGVNSIRDLIRELAVRGVLTDKHHKSKFSAHDQKEGVFNIPASWKWAKLGDVVEFVNGFAFRSDEYIASGVGVVRMSDLKSGQIIPDHMKYVSLDRLSSLAESFQVKPGDIVMGMTGATLGKPCVNKTTVTYLLNQRIGKFVPKEINPEYLLLVLSHLEKSFMNLSFGTGVNNLSTQQIKDSLIPLPPDHEQRKIVETVSALFSICDSLETGIVNAQQISQKFVRSIVSASM